MRSLKAYIVILLLVCEISIASVWGQKVGKTFLSASQTFYTAQTIFDRNGIRYYLPTGGIFTKYETNLYVEYGIDQGVTAFGNFFFLGMNYRDSLGYKSNGGLGNQEAGVQYSLNSKIPATALQFLISFPFYTTPGDPPMGNSQVDLQVSLLLGAPIGKKGFWDGYFGFRKRFESPADQIRAGLTIGFDLSNKLKLLVASNLILGLGNQDSVFSVSNSFSQQVESNLDFSLLKVEPGLVYKFNNNFSGYVGFAFDAYGRSVGAGYAFKVGLWYQY